MNRTFQNLSLAVTLFLASCGGGGGGGSSGGSGLSNLSYPVGSAIYLVGVPIAPNTPTIQGTTTTWSIAPALPGGLLFDTSNGKISGTPAVVSAARDYTVTAANSKGSLLISLHIGVERPSQFLLVTDEQDGSLSLLSIDAATGDMQHEGFATIVEAPTQVRDVTVSGAHTWALAGDPGTIVQVVLDTGTGRMTSGSNVAAGAAPLRLRVRADGKYAYVLDGGTAKILGFSIDPATGVMTAQATNTVAVDAGPLDMALDPKGAFAFVCTSTDKKVSSYGIDAAGKLLAKKGEVVLSGAPTAIAVAPDGEHVCALIPDAKLVAFLDLDRGTGALTLVNTRPTGALTKSVAFHPSGRAVYLTSKAGDRLAVFPIDAATGQLGASSFSIPTSHGPESVSFDPAGLYAFVAAEWANLVDVYTIAPVDLKPTLAGSFTGRGAPRRFANVQGDLPLTKESPFLYTLNEVGDSVSPFSVDNTDGSLSGIGPDVLCGNEPSATALDAYGRFLFVASHATNQIFSFPIDATSGELGVPLPVTLPNGLKEPVALTGDPSGRFLFIAADKLLNDGTKNFLVAYGVNQDTGALEGLVGGAPTSAPLGAANPISVGMDPTGRFLYISTDADFRLYQPLAGSFGAPVITSDPGAPVESYVFDDSGARVWVTMPTPREIRCFDVDPLTGAWTWISSAITPRGPWGLTALRGTNFLFATLPGELPGDGLPDSIASYSVDPTDGALTQVQAISVGLDARGIAADASGRFLYVVNEGGNDLDVLLPDRADGSFEVVGSTGTGLSPEEVVLTKLLH
jgi:6-phosphogluconolactonase (cycloisomerase 2 family)